MQPRQDGSLAIWLATGDFALVGSTEAMGAGTAAFCVVALFRVPAATAAMYAGDLIFETESHEGGHWSYGQFGNATVDVQPIEIARTTLEQKFGTLPEQLVLSPWCAGDHPQVVRSRQTLASAKVIL